VPAEGATLAQPLASFSKDRKKDVPKLPESVTNLRGSQPTTSPSPGEGPREREVADPGKPHVSDAPSSLTEGTMVF